MRTLLVLSLIMSFSAIAQTRVRENIKQQSISSSQGDSEEQVKEDKGKENSGRRKKK